MDRTEQTANSRIKEPEEWTTGDEPMTGAQASYMNTLAREAGQPELAEEELTKAEASERIDALRQQTGRGRSTAKKGRRRSS